MEAQRHSHGLKDPFTKASHTVIPQHFITMAATDTKQEVSPMHDIKVAAALRQKQVRPPGAGQNTPTIPATSASGLDSKWGGLQNNRCAGSTVTRIATITGSARYPRVHPSSSQGQKLVKCPCCYQAIPASELEDSQWRKHVANDLCPYTCILEDCPTPYTLFVTQKEWNEHVMNDHPPHWECPCCEGDYPTFMSLSGMTTHIASQHSDALSDGLEDLLSIAEVTIMGIAKCPLCDSEGPQDSPEIIEHVFQHIHSFSLRSLPWPMDPTFSLERPVGIFDMNHAFKITKDDKGEEYVFRIDDWAETVAPTFNLEEGEKTVLDDKGEKLVFGIAGWPEDRTLEGDQSLQLCNIDRNPPKLSEEELAAIAKSDTDYFAQNGYFIDASGDGQFPSQTSYSSHTQDSIKYSVRQGLKKWVCTLCGVQSIEGDDAYYQHLEHSHTADMEETTTDVELWKCSMLYETYWNGVDGITPIASVAGSPRPRSASLTNEQSNLEMPYITPTPSIAGGASDGDLPEGAWRGASFPADQHGQPGVDVLESRAMKGGGRAEDQWLFAVDADDDTIEDVMARKEARIGKRRTNKVKWTRKAHGIESSPEKSGDGDSTPEEDMLEGVRVFLSGFQNIIRRAKAGYGDNVETFEVDDNAKYVHSPHPITQVERNPFGTSTDEDADQGSAGELQETAPEANSTSHRERRGSYSQFSSMYREASFGEFIEDIQLDKGSGEKMPSRARLIQA
ncbi:hypothetical protein GJ744_002989 [Endocarpon pusillum]|uniref:C2H2-type domain-containing protein n=1 Tax=Endocarpon pusillum TaxID=364733 RepID=A0A8H7E0T9_9EURO|nr:hypothetical protein GJ744_002989 [Endocarpon pusillum]